MSMLVEEYVVSVSISFWLDMPEPTLRRILGDAGFTLVATPPPSFPIAPGIQVTLGPPRRHIASYKSVRISWDDSKFMLNFEGKVKDVVEALKMVEPSFSKHGYPLEKVCHYYEVNFVTQPLDIDNFVDALRNKTNLELKIGDKVLRPFSISFSNIEEPISREHFYKWLHITITPDVNAPQKRVFVQIVKRDIDFKSTLKFIENIERILEQIKMFFTR